MIFNTLLLSKLNRWLVKHPLFQQLQLSLVTPSPLTVTITFYLSNVVCLYWVITHKGQWWLYAFKQIFSCPLFSSLMSCLFCPLWMWNDLTKSLYISVTHISLTFPTLSSFWALLWKTDFLSSLSNSKPRTLNLQHSSMASSSAKQVSGSSGSGLHINTWSSYLIKPKTMAIPMKLLRSKLNLQWTSHP